VLIQKVILTFIFHSVTCLILVLYWQKTVLHHVLTSVVTVSKFSLTIGFGRFWAKILGFSLDLVVLMNAL